MKPICTLCVLVACLAAGHAAPAADWSRIGADAGLSKYSADNIPAGDRLRLQYVKRFYGRFAVNTGNFFYASSVVTRGGKAIVMADDRPSPPASTQVSFLMLDWATGQTTGYWTTPWVLAENDREVDSHHYTNPLIWHDDGRVYMRRGGDQNNTQVFLPNTGQWIPVYNRNAQGTILPNGIDATALMQAYKDFLICRYGHTFYTQEYYAGCISEECFAAPNHQVGQSILGRCRTQVGPSVPNVAGADGLYGSTGRYGDIPKCANDVCVMAALAYTKQEVWPNGIKLWLEATDLVEGRTLWTKVWTSDTGGQQGLSTSISDYWRFIAADSGHYVFFTRMPTQPVTVRAVDLRTGQETWSKALTDPLERPLLAYHGGFVYVIGRSSQCKLDVHTGDLIWQTSHAWPNDQGYVLGNHSYGSSVPMSQDPLFRPAVLTDETVWFVDGDRLASWGAPSAATLVGLSTADGRVVQQIDLRQFYGATGVERLLVVNDLVVADGLLGVLVGVKSAASAHPNSNGMDYQDLYVFRPVRPGDVTGDGKVNILDLRKLALAWGSHSGDANYEPCCDLNEDGGINILDLQIMARNWDT